MGWGNETSLVQLKRDAAKTKRLTVALDDTRAQLAAAQAQLATASEVYCAITGGLLSYPTYDARTILAHYEDDVQKIIDEECAPLTERMNAAEARLEAVRALHFTRGRNILGKPVCNECSPLQPMPCPTLRALDAALPAAPHLEPEQTPDGSPNDCDHGGGPATACNWCTPSRSDISRAQFLGGER